MKLTKVLSFKTKTLTPSLNKFRSWKSYHFGVKKKWDSEVPPSIVPQRAKKGERRIVYIRRYAIRLLDPDNFVGSLKPVIDSVKKHGYIYDDDLEHINLIYEQIKVRKRINQGTEVIVVKELQGEHKSKTKGEYQRALQSMFPPVCV